MAPLMHEDYSSSSSITISEASTPPHEALTSNAHGPEPIAIVGMGCRLPGGVKSPEDLWKLLTEEKSGQCDVPPSRWNIDGFYHPNSARPGSMNTKGGYFIKDDIREFDNGFFGINNLEATYMDPQQRKLLEVTFETFESAGATLEEMSAANVGVYVGNFTIDYITMQAKEADYFHRYHATGMGTTILSNRISHVFNLKGPSVVLDTACSSSLYAVHMACAAIDAGECDSAIAAGANLAQSPEQHLGTMKAGVLSGTSTCHTFDASADGYGRADGIAAVYLKKLSKALEDNDPIRGIIRGTAVNANGKTNGITLPSADGQEAVIKKAYKKAGLEREYNATNYVECHGTGTAVGDPIELEAVSRVFNKRPVESPLHVGSVKTNLGHSEAASGFSSIFKVCMALEKNLIPATIGVKNINPKIKTQEWGVKIVTENTEWPAETLALGKPTRRAGVNSFGYGGANSHAIIEAVDNFVPGRRGLSSETLSERRSTFILPMSANSVGSLEGQLENLASLNPEGLNVVDLAYTLGARRSKLSKRAYTLAGQDALQGTLSPQRFITPSEGKLYNKLPFAFVFTGQGAQWAQMAKELIDEVPSFRKSLTELDNALQKLPHAPIWSLRQAIMDPKEVSQINHVTRSQPVCTAIQVAFVQLLRKWGIEPEVVIGHSSGEIGAAYAAGLLTATEAIIVAYYRGYVVGNTVLPIKGGMMAAGLGPDDAQSQIDELALSSQIKVACINSPESVTISGDASAIEKILAALQAKGTFARKLNTNDRAYHSHHMVMLGQKYEDLLRDNLPPPPPFKRNNKVKWVSSVTGEVMSGKVRPSYWRANLESTVRFSDAVKGLITGSKYHLIELGPHSALEMPIKQTMTELKVKAGDYNYSAALNRGKNAVTCLFNLVGDLFLHGHNIDFAQVNYVEPSTTALASHDSKYRAHQQGQVITSLPTYAWTYDTLLWSEGRASLEYRMRKHPHHDLLGSQRPGGNGLQTSWRNVLKSDDLPWLADHKLEETIVFPGAGYIAMAIEAVSQVNDKSVLDPIKIGLRQFQILKALPLSADKNAAGVEIFAQIKPMVISATSNSKTWWEFEVISNVDGISTTHATCKISLSEVQNVVRPSLVPTSADLETLAIRNWYGQFTKVGLNYGPQFQALKEISTPRAKVGQHAVAKTQLLRGGGEGKETQSNYMIHPITIDIMLQAGIIASTSGVIKTLRANVPVSIEEAYFQTPTALSQEVATIDCSTTKIGFAAYNMNLCLYDAQQRPCAVLKDVRVTGYQGAAQVSDEIEREPMLRVLWKPDITTMSGDGIARYLATFNGTPEEQFAAIVDVISHKNPRLQILDVTNSVALTTRFQDVLRAENAFKRFKGYTRGQFDSEGNLLLEIVDGKQSLGEGKQSKATGKEKYGLVIGGDGLSHAQQAHLAGLAESFGAFLKMTSIPSEPLDGYTTVCTAAAPGKSIEITSSMHAGDKDKKISGNILIVEEAAQKSFNDVLAKQLSESFDQEVERVLLKDLTSSTIDSKSLVVCTIELTRPVLSTLTDSEMVSIKHITDHALSLLWLTGGSNIEGTRPDFALMSGLSRALMLEQPSLQIINLDLDVTTSTPTTVQNVAMVLRQSIESPAPDFEYVQKDELLHISRMLPEEDFNTTFRNKQGMVAAPTPLDEAKPARLTIGTVGQFDTLAFARETPDFSPLNPGTVEVEVKSVGLNAKDFYALAGKVNTKDAMCKLECSGIVTKVASSGITRLAVGDRVVSMGPGHFLTTERFPEWACQKLLDDEDLHVVTTLPLVFSTAIYALHHRANIQEGDSILIHSAAGGLGNAAIQIAQLAKAEIYATVSTDEKKSFLVNTFGIKPENIFNSRNSSFQPAVLAATGGRGVDIVLNSLTGDLLHDSWRVCAPWGRFIEVGKQDLVAAGKLDMEMFRRNVTFSAFDLSELSDEGQPKLNKIASSLLAETMSLYRAKKIKAIEPMKVFDISEIAQAYRYFGLGNRIGKVAISLENGASLIPTLPTKHDATFSPDKTYLMIGCLGGLGRSMSKWMVKRGAKKFCFVGRSGTDRKPARLLVEDMEASGAEVTVVRGDVGVYTDVQRAVAAITGPIGGVIQAAMGLNEALWTSMPNEYWHTGIDPKLIGSRNLYNALAGRSADLDFFLMTSSVSGSVGTATEGNYCAANYFLDVFARFLRSQGMPGISIGLGMISEVGYLHENPEIEALLLRKGIQAINEDELLQILDCCLCNMNDATGYDKGAAAHVLTGLEPLGLVALRKAGFSGTSPTLNDPRASVLASILDSDSDKDLVTNSGMPAELADALANGGEGQSVMEAILQLVVKRFSNLVLQQPDKIDTTKALNQYGMDSMLAAEFRTWFYQAFKVDVPFLTLLSEATTLTTLGELVHDGITKE